MVAQKTSETAADNSDAKEKVCTRNQQLKWTKEIDKGKQIFCMAFALQDDYSDIEYADDNELREYRK